VTPIGTTIHSLPQSHGFYLGYANPHDLTLSIGVVAYSQLFGKKGLVTTNLGFMGSKVPLHFTSHHSLHISTLVSTLANSTLIILFSEMLRNYFFPNQKNIVKDNSEYLGIFHFLK
jgi:hypothetical protein